MSLASEHNFDFIRFCKNCGLAQDLAVDRRLPCEDSHAIWRSMQEQDDKSIEACTAKFNNIERFVGFPRIP